MPRKRIPTRYTNRFKSRAVEDWREAKACGNWERKYSRLAKESQRQPRASAYLPPVASRASHLTLSGSSRKAETTPIEDTMCVFIKNERCLEHTVTVDFIIDMATELMPDVMGSKSPEATKSWC
ncbi:hypothetical protein PR003_g25444 [Phytophthora rubi]|uniref:HTH CENPB-type domain-containing protein n=1 Tax=Phytophthora rubi TaxID=129364 RepID=A0A6A4CEW3_9STRA|nr:hypothetical protein PR001_g24458 [Phytophthora rubi]KAE8985669.1 hypothetical protein PR002_g22575 [Phytophthora rubi]KAE9289825.1 hypothetical protein PR003_g25444 [Phytophthora rubi]